MNKMTRKGFGRIYVEKESQVEQVRAIIKELDEFEFDYLPSKYIAPFSEYPKTVYTGKFDDLDMDQLTAVCWQRGIHIWVYDSHHEGEKP